MTQPSKYSQVLKAIYDSPAGVTIVKGHWKTGKTDFALKLYEQLKQLGLIYEAAGNVQLFEDHECTKLSNKDMQYIDNFAFLKAWMFRDLHRKFFVYDEAMKNAPSKKAMTQLNSEWQRIIPELSKGKVHLIAITQEESMTEKIFGHPTFCIARWEKIDLPKHHPQYRKKVRVSSKGLRQKYEFGNLEATSLNFNPYRSAEWSMEPPNIANESLSLELQIAKAYADGLSTVQICEKFPQAGDRKEVTRYLRKGLVALFRMWHVATVKQEASRTLPPPQLDPS